MKRKEVLLVVGSVSLCPVFTTPLLRVLWLLAGVEINKNSSHTDVKSQSWLDNQQKHVRLYKNNKFHPDQPGFIILYWRNKDCMLSGETITINSPVLNSNIYLHSSWLKEWLLRMVIERKKRRLYRSLMSCVHFKKVFDFVLFWNFKLKIRLCLTNGNLETRCWK